MGIRVNMKHIITKNYSLIQFSLCSTFYNNLQYHHLSSLYLCASVLEKYKSFGSEEQNQKNAFLFCFSLALHYLCRRNTTNQKTNNEKTNLYRAGDDGYGRPGAS